MHVSGRAISILVVCLPKTTKGMLGHTTINLIQAWPPPRGGYPKRPASCVRLLNGQGVIMLCPFLLALALLGGVEAQINPGENYPFLMVVYALAAMYKTSVESLLQCPL